ncbi:MAG TPA: RNA polymerase sigma factor [Candidatus Hydrogenedentes bacterium]|nr:RNA polymerase sigma factor [Candidatus Hydrogenedentota bacterium]HQM48797.1 RNA polymerase sigma factor [Candidatus Hydrogenedentota bacterium]
MPEPSIDTDRDDIRAALDGSEEAYMRLVERHQAEVFRWMWRFSRDRQTVDELVQDVFVEMFGSLPGYAERGPFEHWLHRIAARVGYRHWQQRKRDREHLEPLTPNLEAVLESPRNASPSEAAECLYQLLERLPAKDRLALTLHYFEDLDTLEIAKRLGWSHTLTRVRMHRARTRVKKELDSLGVKR